MLERLEKKGKLAFQEWRGNYLNASKLPRPKRVPERPVIERLDAALGSFWEPWERVTELLREGLLVAEMAHVPFDPTLAYAIMVKSADGVTDEQQDESADRPDREQLAETAGHGEGVGGIADAVLGSGDGGWDSSLLHISEVLWGGKVGLGELAGELLRRMDRSEPGEPTDAEAALAESAEDLARRAQELRHLWEECFAKASEALSIVAEPGAETLVEMFPQVEMEEARSCVARATYDVLRNSAGRRIGPASFVVMVEWASLCYASEVALLAPSASDVSDTSTVSNFAVHDFEEVYTTELKERMSAVLATLTFRERELLKLRTGVGGLEGSVDEICRVFRITKERTRQIEAKALRKLRHPVRARRLAYFLDDLLLAAELDEEA